MLTAMTLMIHRPTYKVWKKCHTLSKEETTRLAARQLKFIQNLRAAWYVLKTKRMAFAVKPAS